MFSEYVGKSKQMLRRLFSVLVLGVLAFGVVACADVNTNTLTLSQEMFGSAGAKNTKVAYQYTCLVDGERYEEMFYVYGNKQEKVKFPGGDCTIQAFVFSDKKDFDMISVYYAPQNNDNKDWYALSQVAVFRLGDMKALDNPLPSDEKATQMLLKHKVNLATVRSVFYYNSNKYNPENEKEKEALNNTMLEFFARSEQAANEKGAKK